ncbi:hypothetical protein JQX13_10555 [Archangium violaceum]|uniref:hypothetical protein n=1 Tax=Archangium violaceum TaxID=83451 RepID=UPI00193C06F5|nr:hypothetical protein [Archangium violaceum]QRK10486.1 hypothetical protein JQX13_10555 [Archangium violaceum]
MSDEQSWRPVEEGRTLGLGGAEGGTIVRDEEHPAGLRLTLEEDPERSFYALTCGISGWLVHARHFGSEAESHAAWDEMKPALVELAMQLPAGPRRLDEATREAGAKLGAFMARFS